MSSRDLLKITKRKPFKKKPKRTDFYLIYHFYTSILFFYQNIFFQKFKVLTKNEKYTQAVSNKLL